MIGSYSAYQTELSNLIIHLRDSEELTYGSIADLLIKKGYRSPMSEFIQKNQINQEKRSKVTPLRLNKYFEKDGTIYEKNSLQGVSIKSQ